MTSKFEHRKPQHEYLKSIMPDELQWTVEHIIYWEDREKWVGYDEAGLELTFNTDPMVVANVLQEYSHYLQETSLQFDPSNSVALQPRREYDR